MHSWSAATRAAAAQQFAILFLGASTLASAKRTAATLLAGGATASSWLRGVMVLAPENKSSAVRIHPIDEAELRQKHGPRAHVGVSLVVRLVER